MLLFLLTGNAILDFFGITLDAFRMAGGILLLLIGMQFLVTATSNVIVHTITPQVLKLQ